MTPETELSPATESEENPSRIPTRLVVLAVLALVVGMIVYSYADWPGSRYIGIANMKVRDYLELLIVSAALALGVFWLNNRQDKRDQRAQADQVERALDAENQRAQDAALEAYLEQMSQLLTDQERPLLRAQPGDNLSVVAWARTKTVLRRMGPERKGNVLRFVNEAGLINKHHPVFRLSGADLRGADLQESFLKYVTLHGADLRGATLTSANLEEADLSEANLSVHVHENKSTQKSSESPTDLSGVNLSGANLNSADLTDADLRYANLSGAYKITYKPSAKDETRQLITAAEVEAQTTLLEGATMPNGQKYEEWLKSKGCREDG